MDASSTSPLLALIESGVRDSLLTRYFALSGLVLVLWEYIITFDQEVQIIWANTASGFSASRIIYRLSRYGLIASLFYANTVLHFLPSSLMNAKSFASMLVFCIIVSAVGTNSYLVMRHLQAWNGRPQIPHIILTALVLTHIPLVVLGAIGMKDMYTTTTYVPFLNTCAVLSKAPTLTPAWSCVIGFDSFAILLLFLNVLDRPRARDADIMLYLRNDGAPFFLIVSALRYTGIVLLIHLPATQYYVTFFLAWPLTSITLVRFIVHGEKLRKRSQEALLGYEDDDLESTHELSYIQ